MPKGTRYSPAQIIGKLCNELVNVELFDTLLEAPVLIEC